MKAQTSLWFFYLQKQKEKEKREKWSYEKDYLKEKNKYVSYLGIHHRIYGRI